MNINATVRKIFLITGVKQSLKKKGKPLPLAD
jgi:hypothetical protein